MPEGPVHKCQHPGGEVVFLEELGTVDLPFEEGVEAENRSAPVGCENGRARGAVGLERHLLVSWENFFCEWIFVPIRGSVLTGKDENRAYGYGLEKPHVLQVRGQGGNLVLLQIEIVGD
jgi:hypothetical protein